MYCFPNCSLECRVRSGFPWLISSICQVTSKCQWSWGENSVHSFTNLAASVSSTSSRVADRHLFKLASKALFLFFTVLGYSKLFCEPISIHSIFVKTFPKWTCWLCLIYMLISCFRINCELYVVLPKRFLNQTFWSMTNRSSTMYDLIIFSKTQSSPLRWPSLCKKKDTIDISLED